MVLRKDELETKLAEDSLLVKNGVLRDEIPLDTSAGFQDFLLACRTGDLRRCQEHINLGVNINGKDNFDYTPLIIASLCGHYDLVKILLESGALAERNTFQGERCIYNALNDKIRNLLLQYDFSKSSDPNVYWSTHVSTLLDRSVPATADISLDAGGRSFELHKFMLAARTPYFGAKLQAQPETTTWRLSSSIPVEAFSIAVRYIYLGDVPRDLVPPGSAVTEDEVARGLDKISKLLGIDHLWESILATHDRRLARQRYQDEVERAMAQVGDFFRAKVLGHKMVVDTSRVDEVCWKHGNSIFADVLLRADVPYDDDDDEEEAEEAKTDSNSNLLGIAASSEGKKRRSVLYPAHRAMLIRSEYFDKMFSGDFIEAQKLPHLRIVTVDCSPPVLELVLAFLYTETVVCPLEHALDLLYAADMLFLDGLKNKAAVAISTLGSASTTSANDTHYVEPVNIYDVVHAAWDLRVQRLEEFGARYLAARLEEYIDDVDFHDLIRESAGRLQRREETDTIELLDDIRYYLSERFRLRFEDAGLEEIMEERTEGNEAVDTPLAGGEQVSTLDGDEDEFESDAVNYQILLDKIDVMLERLKLDA